MSLRRFDGWEPTTTYEHDDAGRVVSSTPESEWNPLEQGWMLALALWDQMRCGGCGGDLRETTEFDDWVGNLPVQCHRCAAITQKQTAYESDYPGSMTSFRWSASRRGR